jgi:hypothetical protein
MRKKKVFIWFQAVLMMLLALQLNHKIQLEKHVLSQVVHLAVLLVL